jgi:hypothetical protein
MRTLREYNKNNKIKNRYIITMVYKTKTRKITKTNKRRYLQNRKSRRMYGGYQDEEQEALTAEGPTLMSNLKAAGQLGVSVASQLAANGIQDVGKFIGIDPNISIQDNMNEIGDKIGNVNDALNSRDGKKLKQEASELVKNSIDILNPSIKTAEIIAKDGLVTLGETGTSMLVAAGNALPPVLAITEGAKAFTAAAQAGKTIADLTTTGTKAIHDLEGQYEKAESIWERIKGLANNYVSDGLAVAQERVNKEGQTITSQMNIHAPEIPDTNYNYQGGKASDSFKKLHKEALMVGGRSRKSHLDFLAPHVNRSQILRQYGGKMNKTQRIRQRR